MSFSIGHSHEARAEHQDGAQSQGSRIMSWLDRVQRLHARDDDYPSLFNTNTAVPYPMTISSGREGVLAAQRHASRLCLPAGAHTHHDAAALNPPTHCYSRLREDGVAIVADGHPFACACFGEMLLHSSREAKYRPPLPAEPCLYPPIRQNDKRQTYLSLAMENCAGICYPLEKFRIMSYIPLKQNKYRDRLFSTPIALESVLAVGSLMQPEESSIAFATAHAAFVERMITDCISDGTGKSDPVKRLVLQTFHCLAALYIGLGDLSALRTHTKALQQFIESEDPLDVVDSHDLTKARKSLIDKLICTGFPQEHIPRRFQLLPCLLQPHDIGLIMSTLRPHLQACHVNADIADNMIAACIFAWTMREAKECGFGETFEPENVMEDYDCLQIDLLTTPHVLRHQFRSVTSPPSPEDLQVSSPSTSGLSHCAHQDLLETFEDAVRITTLLCLRAAILQTSPTAKQSYSMLLNRLVDRLQILLDWIYPKAYDSAFIDPTVLNEQQNQGNMLSISSARPFLIWMSIIGYQLSVYYGLYHKGWSYHHSEGCIYLKILVSVGICDTADVDLCTNDDVAIFDMLNLNWATDYDRQSFELLRWIVK